MANSPRNTSPSHRPPRDSSVARGRKRPGRPRGRSAKRDDPLSRTLASGALARLVTYFGTHPDETPHVRALQRITGLAPRSLQTELRRLEGLGIIQRQVDGRHVRYALDEGNPRWRALRGLVLELADVADVLRLALAGVQGVEASFLFGSMARGTDIREGSDIDLFILHGQLPEELLARRTLDAGVLLGREVNVVAMNREELVDQLANGSDFLEAVLRGPKRWVVGNEVQLGGAPVASGVRGT